MKFILLFSSTILVFVAAMASQLLAERAYYSSHEENDTDTIAVVADTLHDDDIITVVDEVTGDSLSHDPTRLTEADFQRAADSLRCEIAAIKAVVDCEAGPTHKGFDEPGCPIVNFDNSVYRKFCAKRGINSSAYKKLYTPQGNGQDNAWAKLQAAMKVDRQSAIEGTFWGMFQIGGFNWSKCGCKDIDEFYERMCESEGEQLMLFVAFIKTTKLDRHLRNHNWAAFSRSYNGPSYARRGYHTRMASSYARHSSNK